MAFSVKQLLFMMAVVAFGVAALVNADKPFVFQLFDLLTLAILIAIAYGAWINQGCATSVPNWLSLLGSALLLVLQAGI